MRGFGAVLVSLILLMPVALAQQGLELYVQPKTAEAKSIQDLFNIVLWIAIVVFVFVEGLLIYVIWRFRNNKTVPKGETHRGHTKAEIAWSVVPALVLIFIGILSVQVLERLDRVPEDTDFTIGVEGQQFAWVFTYPDPNVKPTINKLYIEEGSRVKLDITSKDVQHAVWIQEFGIKLDAIPGRVNHQWFDAPAPGTYFMQCAEYCGVGHHGMRAEVIVYAKGENPNGPFGAPPNQGGGGGVDDVPKDQEFTLELLESGGSGSGRPWSINPPTITVKRGEGVHLNSVNAGKGVHNLTVPAFGVTTPEQPAGSTETIAFVADRVGTFEYFCGIPGHKNLGMTGTITVTE